LPPILLYKGFGFPEEIISDAVWLYYFLLSLRDVR
jgi:transposase-like protein